MCNFLRSYQSLGGYAAHPSAWPNFNKTFIEVCGNTAITWLTVIMTPVWFQFSEQTLHQFVQNLKEEKIQ